MTAWLVIAAIGAGTFAMRVAPQLVLDRIVLPDAVERSLRFAGPVALVALAVPVLVQSDGALTPDVWVPRAVAVAVAAAVGVRTRSLPLAVAAGLPALWILGGLLR